LAVHIEEAEQMVLNNSQSSSAARASISPSLPTKPSWRSTVVAGRRSGGIKPCDSPRSISKRIFARPCNAASRGRETAPALLALAILPAERPA
jgi:hypothetical protein